jgi:ubiquinone/menaquinone biosynthesis C-methylase UbiE
MHKLVPLILIIVLACSQSNTNEEVNSDNRDTTEKVLPNEQITSDKSDQNLNFDLLVKNYEDPDRKNWQNPQLVIEKLGDISGKTIADIGAGTGYFTFRLAPFAQKVIAIDIDSLFLSYIEDKRDESPEEIYEKIEIRLSQPDDPLLINSEIDIALIVNTFHFIDNRIDYLKKIKHGIKEGGKLVIVDFKEGSMPVGPSEETKIPPSTAVDEVMKAGFGDVNVDLTSLQYQYIIIAM